jgi:hypothetical protein
MTRDEAAMEISRELEAARKAESIGNAGMARVCSRRAAGIALAFWLQHNPRHGWGTDALSRLKSVQTETSLPESVRNAALRLTTRLAKDFTSPATQPVEDATIIINYFMENS